jgi:GDP-mannose 4,6-dehydratase|tara:strand:+ start:28875 stop:29858 length:984 start_codon:yes stop_codon:yes gene_type:complete
MKFLITGITGFAGPHLANLLHKKGHEVHGLIRRTNGMEADILDTVSDEVYNSISFHYSDLGNNRSLRNIFKDNEFDGVFHLAAQSHPPSSFLDPLGTFEANIMGSANLIQAITDLQPDCKLMFCSTSEVYGNGGQDGRKIHWKDTILPANPYGASKAATDLYLQERMENGFIQGFITRAFSHTGPRRGKNFSISSDAFQVARMMKGMQDKALLIGNLSTTRVVMDVRDTVRAYYLAMVHTDTQKHIFNICGDTPRQMQFFTDKLIEISGLKDVKQEIYDKFWRPHEIYYQHGDSTNLVELTQFKEEYDIEQTLTDLLAYWCDKITSR